MIAIFAAVFIFVLLAVVSEASDDSDAAKYTITYSPGDGHLKVNDVERTEERYYFSEQTHNSSSALDSIRPTSFRKNGTSYYYYKDGYTFSCWYDRDNPSVTYNPNQTNVVFDKNTTLVALWVPYKVTYYPNGGTSPSSAADHYVQTNDDALIVPNNIFTRNNKSYQYLNPGNTFMGWATTAGGPVKYVCGDELDTLTGDVSLYAVWTGGAKIIFDSNGGDSPQTYYQPGIEIAQNGSPLPIYVPGDHFVADDGEFTYSKNGYVFQGWSTNSKATEPMYTRGSILAPTDTGYVLYAVWKPNAFEVTFVYDSVLGYDPNLAFVTQSNINLSQTAEIRKAKVLYNFQIGSENHSISTYEAEDGYKFVTVQIVIRNNSLATGYNLGLLKLNLYCTDGNVYIYDDAGTYYNGGAINISDVVLDTRSSRVYSVVYQIPDGVTAKYLVPSPLYDNTYSAEVEIDYGYTFDSATYMTYKLNGSDEFKIVGWSTIPLIYNYGEGAYVFSGIEDTFSRKITILPPMESLTLFPIWAYVKSNTNVDGSLLAGVEITDCNGIYYVTGSSESEGILVSGGSPHIYLDNVNLDFSEATGEGQAHSPFILTDSATLTLVVMSDSYFRGADDVRVGNYNLGYAGINVRSGTTLIISKDSLGRITAEGGCGTSVYSYYSDTGADIDGRAGSGIGANGNAGTQYDDGCGNIWIYGGTISAYGGYGLVDMSGYYSYYYSQYRNYDLVAAQGIGGTTVSTGSDKQPISIFGGTVTAATGHVYGTSGDGTEYIVSSNQIKYIIPIYDGSNNSMTTPNTRTYISPDARVTQVYMDEASTNIDEDDSVKIYFSNVGNGDTIGNALSVTITRHTDGETITIDIGGMEISQGTIIFVDKNDIDDQSDIILVTRVGNYYTGKATWSSNYDRYNVSLTQSNRNPHGTVEIYVNEILVNGGESFGSINPSESFTVAGQANTLVYPFELILNEGYRCVGVRTYSTTSSGATIAWTDHPIDESKGESITTVNGHLVYAIELKLSGSGAGTKNYVSFTIQKVLVKVNIKNTFTERKDDLAFPERILTPGSTDPTGIQWTDNSRTTGTQYVYFKESMSYVIDVSVDTGNPYSVRWIKVNGVAINYAYDAEGNMGRYEFIVNDISEETTIEIRYGPTVKLTCYTTFVAGVNNSTIKVLGILEDGTDGFMLGDSEIEIPSGSGTMTRPTKVSYVDKGTVAYFKITPEGPWTSSGQPIGIQSITSKTGNNANNISIRFDYEYAVGIISEDTEINVTFTVVTWDLIFNSDYIENGNSQHTSYRIRVFDHTYYTVPTKDLFESLGLYDKVGFEIDKWAIDMYDDNQGATPHDSYYIDSTECAAGVSLQITCKMVFTVVWEANPHNYVIHYDMPDDASLNSPEIRTYTVDTPTFTLSSASRPGYEFKGWITEGQLESEASLFRQIEQGSVGDRYYISVWKGNPVTFNLVDPMGFKSDEEHDYIITTQDFVIGSPFSELPVYGNYRKQGTADNYVFAGWSLNPDGSGRITDSTLVEYSATGYNLYIIWVEGNKYIVNIVYNYGGTVTADIFGVPVTDSIELEITAFRMYKASKITINGIEPTTPQFNPTTNPYTYTYPTAAGILFYDIVVTFVEIDEIPIPRPTGNVYTYDGTQKTGIDPGDGYTVSPTNNTATNSGTYQVMVSLDAGYIWEDGTSDSIPVSWQINKRRAYIIAYSEARRYTGTDWTTQSNSFTLLCVIPGVDGKDGVTITSTQRTIRDVGTYTNDISVSGADNYEFTIIKGTYTIYGENTSTFDAELSQHVNSGTSSRAASMPSSTEPGRVIANIPSIGRKVDA